MLYIIFFILLVLIGIITFFIYQYVSLYRVKKYCRLLGNKDFKQGVKKAQVIDLREENEFSKGHILGARNIPYSVFKNMYSDLRPDLPVYLYEQNKWISSRAARFLHKKGYKKLGILNNGYRKWDGKVKKS